MSLTEEVGDLEAPAEPEFPPREFDLPLRKALTVNDVQLTSLALREPTGAEWELIFEQPPEKRRRYAVSLIAGVPMKDCGQVGIGDLVRAETYLNAFFEVGQAIRGW